MKLKHQIKLSTIVVSLVSIIIILSSLFIMRFQKALSPRLLQSAKIKLTAEGTKIIVNSFDKQILDKYDLNKIIIVSKNKQDEVIGIDFDMNKAYAISLAIATNIKKNMLDDSLIVYLPMGMASDNVYFANLGPKIPVKVSLEDTLSSSLSTKVKSYGLNNTLIEVYMNVSLEENIIIPFNSDKINIKSQILLSSQIIQGDIPQLYSGLLNTNSSLINVPLTN